MEVSIRQLVWKKANPCLKGGFNRTARAAKNENLSEWRSQSDSRGGKKRRPVRMEVSIGQLGRQKAKTCPNGGPNRTAEAAKSEDLSEWRSQSDTMGSKKRRPVRMEVPIGQLGGQKVKTC